MIKESNAISMNSVFIYSFRQQTKYFTIVSSIASFGYLILALVGVFGLENSQQIGCSIPVGETLSGDWIFFKTTGSVFITLHIVVIIVQTASINSSLYKVPKGNGYFEDHLDELKSN